MYEKLGSQVFWIEVSESRKSRLDNANGEYFHGMVKISNYGRVFCKSSFVRPKSSDALSSNKRG